jgi:hypothetical protein
MFLYLASRQHCSTHLRVQTVQWQKSGRRKHPTPHVPTVHGGGGGVEAPLILDLGARWGGLECMKLYIHSLIRFPEGWWISFIIIINLQKTFHLLMCLKTVKC